MRAALLVVIFPTAALATIALLAQRLDLVWVLGALLIGR